MDQPGLQIKDVIEKLLDQHKQVFEVIEEFSPILDDVKTIGTAVKARGFLDKLTSLLDVHLKVEDKLLYPILKNSPNQKIRDIAMTFSSEMGNIAGDIGRYMEKWNTSISIADESERFIKETNQLISVLKKRVAREDNELFPLLMTTS